MLILKLAKEIIIRGWLTSYSHKIEKLISGVGVGGPNKSRGGGGVLIRASNYGFLLSSEICKE